MSRAYTSYIDSVWKAFKSTGLERTEKEFVKWGLETQDQILDSEEGEYVSKKSLMLDLWFCFLWRFRSVEHFFIKPGLISFFESVVTELSDDYFKPIPQPKFVSDWDNERKLNNGAVPSVPIGKIPSSFVLHFCSNEMPYSVMFNVCIPADSQNQADWYTLNIKGDEWCITVSTNNLSSFLEANPNVRPEAIKALKAVLGFSLYIDAFPETIRDLRDGDIGNVKQYSLIGGKKRIVECNDLASSETKHAISPHWVTGHFRVLRSEAFTKKRWQTIFIKGHFKGGGGTLCF